MARLGLVEFADRADEYIRVIVNSSLHKNDNELFKGKITMPQFVILDRLLRERESNMTALAKHMHVSTAAMTGMIVRLVRDGYTERIYDSGDRRVVKIRLTPLGAALVKKINAQRHQMIIKVFGKLSETDRSNYLGILAKVKDVLNR